MTNTNFVQMPASHLEHGSEFALNRDCTVTFFSFQIIRKILSYSNLK